MLAKKIRNSPGLVPERDPFAARLRYICSKAVLTRVVNLAGDWPDAARQMQYSAGLNPGLRAPASHLVLSWHETERPTDAQMIAAAEEVMSVLGADEHQQVIARSARVSPCDLACEFSAPRPRWRSDAADRVARTNGGTHHDCWCSTFHRGDRHRYGCASADSDRVGRRDRCAV